MYFLEEYVLPEAPSHPDLDSNDYASLLRVLWLYA